MENPESLQSIIWLALLALGHWLIGIKEGFELWQFLQTVFSGLKKMVFLRTTEFYSE